jgi:transposase
MNITTIGIDLAKNLIQVHGIDERGKAVLKKQLRRNQVLAFFANLARCLIGMEACGSAHYWARRLTELGHTVRLIAGRIPTPRTVRTILISGVSVAPLDQARQIATFASTSRRGKL